ncbi:hypothetical protein CONLIGDRAFT_428895 [Coniochaeta ligniaria NRRL 30616]|uniref:Uncharacterized protein n=1 Tax=Coniochaeta ligniaria NRRL 30616 TaxID=1408157 RepID=A0A1J7JIG6_9PEZI|nr:hypothetical protein CONLIGDRAFT_428895 [Coniochaeta ligniaria NRRL 30616]
MRRNGSPKSRSLPLEYGITLLLSKWKMISRDNIGRRHRNWRGRDHVFIKLPCFIPTRLCPQPLSSLRTRGAYPQPPAGCIIVCLAVRAWMEACGFSTDGTKEAFSCAAHHPQGPIHSMPLMTFLQEAASTANRSLAFWHLTLESRFIATTCVREQLSCHINQSASRGHMDHNHNHLVLGKNSSVPGGARQFMWTPRKMVNQVWFGFALYGVVILAL